MFDDTETDLVFVTTQHDSHAMLAESALAAGKAVWLEKPVGLTAEEVDRVALVASESSGFLMVGYNRRFSSHAVAIRDAFSERSGPLAIQYVVAAGETPSNTWLMDPKIGGGRIVGEVCHFVDLCTFLVGSPPRSVFAQSLGRNSGADDSMIATLMFPDGSSASLSYLAKASPDLPKERFEVHADGRSALCENFRTTVLPGGKKIRGVNQDKGQEAAIAQTLAAIRAGGPSPISIREIVATSYATFKMQASMRTGRAVDLEVDS